MVYVRVRVLQQSSNLITSVSAFLRYLTASCRSWVEIRVRARVTAGCWSCVEICTSTSTTADQLLNKICPCLPATSDCWLLELRWDGFLSFRGLIRIRNVCGACCLLTRVFFGLLDPHGQYYLLRSLPSCEI